MENKNFTVTDKLLASRGQRVWNFIIDSVIVYIIWICAGETLLIIADISKSVALTDWIKSMNYVEKTMTALIVAFFYYSLTEIYFSRSIAKYFTKTLVVMHNGSKPDVKTILQRTLCRLIPLDPFSYFGHISRGWHDSISQTYVVQKEAFVKQKGIVLVP